MQVPKGADHIKFLQECRKKKIRVTSKFQGVYMNINAGSPSWMARCQVGGENVFLGRFPFTEEGEIDAGKAYEKYLRKIGVKMRYKEKRIYEWAKK